MTTESTGLPRIGNDIATRMQIGYCHKEVVNSSAADANAVHQYCRAISVDTDGVTKIKYKDHETGEETTEVLVMKAGVLRQVRNVITVYRYYVGSAAVTTVYSDAGTLVNGVKLHW